MRLAQIFALLVVAAYLVSFTRLHAGSPQSGEPAGKDARMQALLPWSLTEPSLETALARGRAFLVDTRRQARIGNSSGAVEKLLGAFGAARDIASGPFPAHDLAALRLAGEATAAAEVLRTDPSSLAERDLLNMAELLAAIRRGEIAWRPSKVRAAFHGLLSSMYANGDGGRLTAKGLRIFQAWEGKDRSEPRGVPAGAGLLLTPGGPGRGHPGVRSAAGPRDFRPAGFSVRKREAAPRLLVLAVASSGVARDPSFPPGRGAGGFARVRGREPFSSKEVLTCEDSRFSLSSSP